MAPFFASRRARSRPVTSKKRSPSRSERAKLRVGGAAGFMLAARRRAIGLIDVNVIVARGANHTVNRLAELLVASELCGVIGASLFAADGHLLRSLCACDARLLCALTISSRAMR